MVGNDTIPAILRLVSAEPSVDASATPPPLELVSVEFSSPDAAVVNPRTISLSITLKSSIKIKPDVPPIEMFPPTFRLLLICKSPAIVVFPVIVGLRAKPTVGVEPSPVPAVTKISFATPEID